MKVRTLVEQWHSWGRVFGVDLLKGDTKMDDLQPPKAFAKEVIKLSKSLQAYHKVREDDCNYGVPIARQRAYKARMLKAGKRAAQAIRDLLVMDQQSYSARTADELQFVVQSDPRGWPLVVLQPGEDEDRCHGFRPLLREYE